MRSLVVLIFTFFFMLAAVKDTFIAAMLYWWFAIFRPQSWIWWNVSSLHLPLVAAILFIPVALLKGYRPRLDNKLSVYMVIWYVLALAAYVHLGCASGVGKLVDDIINLAVLILVVLVTERLMENQKKLLYIIATVALSLGFYAGKAGIVSIMHGGSSQYGAANLTGLFAGSNAFAMGSGMLVFYIIFVYQQVNNAVSVQLFPKFIQRPVIHQLFRWGLFVTIAGTIYNIIALFSRGSALGTLVGFVVMAFLHPQKKKIFAITIPLIVIAIAVLPIPKGYVNRIDSAFVGTQNLDKSAESRPYFWGVAMSMVKDHPFGIGPGCFADYYDKYDTTNGLYGHYRSVHSSHFQILVESGYIGFVVWLLLIFTAWQKQFRIRKLSQKAADKLKNPRFYNDMAIMLICSQTVFVLGGAFYEWAHNDLIWLSWGITIALERVLNRELSNVKNEPQGVIKKLK